MYVHRDLGIGLKVADVERNIFYHSAASRSIIDAEARSSRAEELRLLYVAMTRARDHLILTGQLAKAGRLAETRDYWKDHAAPLPEDVLLKGGTFLDWLLPALACCNLSVRWPDGPAVEKPAPEVVIRVHAAIGMPRCRIAAGKAGRGRRDHPPPPGRRTAIAGGRRSRGGPADRPRHRDLCTRGPGAPNRRDERFADQKTGRNILP